MLMTCRHFFFFTQTQLVVKVLRCVISVNAHAHAGEVNLPTATEYGKNSRNYQKKRSAATFT